MFQTDVIHFLQSFHSPALTYFMKAITSLGNEFFLIIILLTVTSGINFRKGFILIQLLIITGLLTQIGKNFFALPRPWFVDSTLSVFGKNSATSLLDMGAKTFFGSLPKEAVENYRLLNPDSYGLPSGHTSSAVALWASSIILFRNNFVKFVSVLFLILIPVSRLYLARHFMADIIAGYILGFSILTIFYIIILKPEALAAYLSSVKIKFTANLNSALLMIYLILLPVLFIFIVPAENAELAGYLLGVNIAYIAVGGKEFPEYKLNLLHAFYRVILTLFIFLIIGIFVTFCCRFLFASPGLFTNFLVGAIITASGGIFSIKTIRYFKLSS